MNFLKKGPEIKLSEIKVPGFVRDIYLDLKERHLLPLAVILLLAIVVVPFALGNSSSGEAPEVATSGGTTSGATAVSGSDSGELVAKSAPGLRDYRRRLDHLTSKNPFRQQYQQAEGSGTGEGSSEGGEEGSSTTIEGSEAGGGENATEFTLKHHIVYYSYAIDVKVTTGGGAQETRATESAGGTVAASPTATAGGGSRGGKTQVRHNLPELTMLPSRETPAVIYMGSTKDGKKALMLVSSAVNSIFGDAPCALGSTTCELLAMEPGLPETFVYGDDNRTFKIEVLQIHLVESDKLEKAPLGKPHKHPEG
jgi:hypothetical protein